MELKEKCKRCGYENIYQDGLCSQCYLESNLEENPYKDWPILKVKGSLKNKTNPASAERRMKKKCQCINCNHIQYVDLGGDDCESCGFFINDNEDKV